MPESRFRAPAGRMPPRQRRAVYSIFGGLWISGCGWLILDQFFRSQGQFGPMPNPAQPPLLLVHGVVAIGSLYLLGWLSARHVLRWWSSRLRRVSGALLTGLMALLTLSGFALFFASDDRVQHVVALAHDVLGVAITGFAIQHWFFARRRVMRSAASRP